MLLPCMVLGELYEESPCPTDACHFTQLWKAIKLTTTDKFPNPRLVFLRLTSLVLESMPAKHRARQLQCLIIQGDVYIFTQVPAPHRKVTQMCI